MKTCLALTLRILILGLVALACEARCATLPADANPGETVTVAAGTNASEVDIQQALDRLPAAGGTVVLSPGVYAIHNPVFLNRNHLALRGSGPATILRLAAQANCPVLILGIVAVQPGLLVTDLAVADLVIDGNRRQQTVEQWRDAHNVSGIQNNGVMIQSVSHSRVEHVVTAHCRSGGLVTANGTHGLTVSGFTAFDNEFDGLACYRTEDSVFTGLDLHDNQAAGISLDWDFNHNRISNASLADNDLGIFMRRANRNQFENLIIQRSRHDGVFMAQWFGRTAAGWQLIPDTECAGNHFTGLEIYDCAGVAFRVQDAACVNNVIEDGIFSGNQKGGLVQAGANLVRIQDLLD